MYVFVYVVLVVSSLLLVIDKLLSLYSLHPPLVTATIIVYLHSLYPWSLHYCCVPQQSISLVTGHCYHCCIPTQSIALVTATVVVYLSVHCCCYCYCYIPLQSIALVTATVAIIRMQIAIIFIFILYSI